MFAKSAEKNFSSIFDNKFLSDIRRIDDIFVMILKVPINIIFVD